MSHENNHPVTRIFVNALKTIIKNAFKLVAIAFAWSMKLVGMILTKMGESIEKMIVKKNTIL